METLFLILLIIFIIGIIGSIGAILYFKMDEKNVQEVSTKYLQRLGKKYTKEEFEDLLFNQYVSIYEAINSEDYLLLRDLVSDDEYNKILMDIKECKEKNISKVVTNINKGFSKLINYKLVGNQEKVNVLIQYSSIEYTKDLNEGNIIAGSETNKIFNQYALTFVKDKSSTENIVCPSCGYQSKALLRSKCPICSSTIASKQGHWVYVGKERINIQQ